MICLILKLALYFAAGFCVMVGIAATLYFLHVQVRKNISVSEFRSRLKKLLK